MLVRTQCGSENLTMTTMNKILSATLPDGNSVETYFNQIRMLPQDYADLGIHIGGWDISPLFQEIAIANFYELIINKILNQALPNMSYGELYKILHGEIPPNGAFLIDYLEDMIPDKEGLEALDIPTLGYWNSDIRGDMHYDFYKIFMETILEAGETYNV